MKLFEVKMSIPHKWGSGDSPFDDAAPESGTIGEYNARWRSECVDRMSAIKGVRRVSEHSEEKWLVTESALINVIAAFGIQEHSKEEIMVEKIDLMFNAEDPIEAVDAMLQRLEVSCAKFINYQSAHNEEFGAFNHKVEAPIPGPHLLSVNRLMLCEDYCTDALQGMLDEGWRMVAVCPQEARRPDYVLGRFEPLGGPGTRAQRG